MPHKLQHVLPPSLESSSCSGSIRQKKLR